jgi:hypothetical protein
MTDLKTRAQQGRPAPTGGTVATASEATIEVEVGEDPEAVPVKVAWSRAMRFCKALEKGSKAVVKEKGTGKVLFTYNYRGADDVVTLAGVAFRLFGVIVTLVKLEPVYRNNGQAVTCLMTAHWKIESLGDGQIDAVSCSEAMDYGGDKATVKASTQALRIFLTNQLMLPTGKVSWDSDASPSRLPPLPTPEELRDEMLSPETSRQRMSTIFKTLKDDPDLGSQVVAVRRENMAGLQEETLLALNVRLAGERAAAAVTPASEE